MNKQRFLAVLGLGLGLSGFVGANAQTTGVPFLSGYEARIGAFFPSSNDARDAEGDTWFTAGVERRLYALPSIPGTGAGNNLTASLDYYGSGDLYAIPLLVNYRYNQGRYFFAGGIGVAFNKDFDNDTGTDFAWQVSAGVNLVTFPTTVSAMIRYLGNGGDKLDGFAATIGVQF